MEKRCALVQAIVLKVFCSLLLNQLAQPEGTVDVPQLLVLLKDVPQLFVLLKGGKFMNEVTGTVLQLDLGLQRLLHPSWDLESVSCKGSEVSSSVFVTLGCHQLNGSCCFARPQSVSVFVFLCLYLHLPPSSSACVFVCLWCHLSLSSFVSVVVPCGCSRGY